MKRIFVLVVMFLLIGISQMFSYKFWYNSPYDKQFENFTKDQYAVLIAAMEASEPDMVYSAIRRIGELKITNARQRVYEWLGQTNPESVSDSADWRNVFRISIWALGHIGDEASVLRMSVYWRNVTDKQAQVLMIEAFGNRDGSVKALEMLNRLTETVTDERIAYVLVDAILKHNSKTSMLQLLKMASDSRRITGSGLSSNFSRRFKRYANAAAAKIAQKGH